MIRYELKHAVGARRKIDFDKEDFNYGFSTPQRGNFIIPKSGWYNIVVILATSTTGGFNASLRKNGSIIFKLTKMTSGPILQFNEKWDIGTADTIVYCDKGNTISAHTENAGTMTGDPLANNIYIRFLF